MTHDPPRTDLARLEALRARLEAVVSDPATTPRDLASVSREYRILVEKISAMTPAAKASPLDEIATRRAKRGAS